MTFNSISMSSVGVDGGAFSIFSNACLWTDSNLSLLLPLLIRCPQTDVLMTDVPYSNEEAFQKTPHFAEVFI